MAARISGRLWLARFRQRPCRRAARSGRAPSQYRPGSGRRSSAGPAATALRCGRGAAPRRMSWCSSAHTAPWCAAVPSVAPSRAAAQCWYWSGRVDEHQAVGINSLLITRHWARRRATSGRSCSPASTVFFKAPSLGVHEAPHRAVIDLETALCQFRHQSAQRERAALAAFDQPVSMRADDRFRLVPPSGPARCFRSDDTGPTSGSRCSPRC